MLRGLVVLIIFLFLISPCVYGQSLVDSRIELTEEEKGFLKANPVLLVSNEEGYVPYDFNISGFAKGFSIDLIDLLASKIGVTVSYVNGYSWPELIHLFEQKKLHIIHTLSLTPKREEMGLFTSPYWHYKNYYVIHQKAEDIHYPHQLYGKNLAVGKGWWQETFFAANHPEIHLVPMVDVLQMLETVSNGQVDATILDINVARYLSAQQGIKDIKISGWVKGYDNGENRKLHMMVQKDAPELQSILNKALAALSPQEFLSLQDKWFDSRLPKTTDPIVLSPKEQDFIRNHSSVTLGGGVSFAPFIMLDKIGQAKGYDKDVAEIIKNRTGLNIQYKVGAWKNMLSQAKSYEIDGLTASGKNESREQYLTASRPYLTLTSFVVVKKGNPSQIRRAEDLTGKRLALQRYNSIFEKIAAPYKQDNEVIYYDTLTGVLRAIVSNEADFTFFDESVHYQATRYGIGQFLESVMPIGDPFDLYVYLRKDYPELASIVNKGLESITEKEKHELREKWLLTQPLSTSGLGAVALTPEKSAYLRRQGSISVTSVPLKMPYVGQEKLDGMVHDYSLFFAQQIGTEFSYSFVETPKKAVQNLLAGNVDAILVAEYLGDNVEGLSFTTPYLKVPLAVATTNDTLFIEDIRNELDEQFAVVKGSSVERKFRERYPATHLILVDTILEGLNLVKYGDVYGFIGTPATIAYTIQDNFLTNVKIAGKIPIEISYSIATRSSSSLLLSILQKAVGSLNLNKQRQIYNKWVAAKYEEAINYDLVWRILIGATVFVMLILLWNRQIDRNRKLKQRALDGLAKTQKKLEETNVHLERLAKTDQLTGLNNRLKLNETLQTEIERKARYSRELSIILLDIDKFKLVNDTFGHQAGDEVLKTFARLLKENLRESDIIGRWGGEEFMIVCPETNLSQATDLAEKLRKKIHSHIFEHAKTVTSSFGVAELKKDESEAHLIQKADLALYRAKEGGRNRVEQG